MPFLRIPKNESQTGNLGSSRDMFVFSVSTTGQAAVKINNLWNLWQSMATSRQDMVMVKWCDLCSVVQTFGRHRDIVKPVAGLLQPVVILSVCMHCMPNA